MMTYSPELLERIDELLAHCPSCEGTGVWGIKECPGCGLAREIRALVESHMRPIWRAGPFEASALGHIRPQELSDILSAQERDLLVALIRWAPDFVPYAELRGLRYPLCTSDIHAISVAIHRLRGKLVPWGARITNEIGMGYRICFAEGEP